VGGRTAAHWRWPAMRGQGLARRGSVRV